MTQENFRKLFPDIGKKFPEKPLSHDPFLGKNIFSWVSTHEIYLEIVSKKSFESIPKIAKSGKGLEKVSGISPKSPPVFWNQFPGFAWVKWLWRSKSSSWAMTHGLCTWETEVWVQLGLGFSKGKEELGVSILLVLNLDRHETVRPIQPISVCHVNDCASTATCRSDSTATYGYKCVCNNIVLADTIKVTKHEKSSIETLECPCSFKKKMTS